MLQLYCIIIIIIYILYVHVCVHICMYAVMYVCVWENVIVYTQQRYQTLLTSMRVVIVFNDHNLQYCFFPWEFNSQPAALNG